MRAAGYIYSSNVGYEVGENIAWGTLWLATPRSIVAGLDGLAGHRDNILDAHFRDTGFGVSPHLPARWPAVRPAGSTRRTSAYHHRLSRRVRGRPSAYLPALETLRVSATKRQGEATAMGVLDGKSAIVTGSARGIGRATAELLVAHGAQVLINDLDGDVAEQAASEIAGETAVFAGDLTKPGVPDQLVQKAIDSFGKIDIIVNNAGYTIDAPVHKMSDEHFQAMLDIHTVVPFRVIRAAAPHLREPAKKEREEGKEVFRKIVNVSSTSGTFGNAGQANYSAGKAGVVGLTKTLAKEWGQFKVNVNAVAFGFIDTRLTQAKVDENTMEKDGEKIQLGIPEQMRQMASMLIPLGRPATPEEAAGRRVLPVLAVVQLRARPDAARDRRAVRRDDRLSAAPAAAQVEQRSRRSRRPRARPGRPQRGHLAAAVCVAGRDRDDGDPVARPLDRERAREVLEAGPRRIGVRPRRGPARGRRSARRGRRAGRRGRRTRPRPSTRFTSRRAHAVPRAPCEQPGAVDEQHVDPLAHLAAASACACSPLAPRRAPGASATSAPARASPATPRRARRSARVRARKQHADAVQQARTQRLVDRASHG